MNTNGRSPLFYILEANPKRYIKTTSTTIVMVIRAVEGVIAAFLSYRVFGYLLGLFSGNASSVFALPGLLQPNTQSEIIPGPVQSLLEEQLADIMPEGETIDSLMQQGLATMMESLSESMSNATGGIFTDPDSAIETLLTPGSLEIIITMIATAALLAILICAVVEAAAFIVLRFALKGSAAAKIAHKVIFIASLILLLSGICLIAIFINKCRLLGITITLLVGQLRTLAIVTGVGMVVLVLRVFYHWDVAKVLSAVDYEIRMEFKETDLKVRWLPGNSLIFILLALAATVLMVIKFGFLSLGAIAATVLVVKYVMVYFCWGNYHQCHM